MRYQTRAVSKRTWTRNQFKFITRFHQLVKSAGLNVNKTVDAIDAKILQGKMEEVVEEFLTNY